MRIVVIGSKGQLGTDLVNVLGKEKDVEVIPLSHREIEITDYGQSFGLLTRWMPDIIINTAAYNRVDDAEDQYGLAFAVNAFGPRNLASIAKELDARLVHISTDYVFSGYRYRNYPFERPYSEKDIPNPINTYGISKLAGEYFVRMILDESKYLIIRTSGLYGQAESRAKGGNFVEAMLKLAEKQKEIKVVDDQTFAPTYTLDLAKNIEIRIKVESCGLHHITNDGSCSWYQFAKEIFEIMGVETKVIPISSEEFGAKAKRPPYSVLENSAPAGLRCRLWQKALKAYLEETGRIKMEG